MLLVIGSCIVPNITDGQVIVWNFDDSSNASINTVPNVTISNLLQWNNNGITTMITKSSPSGGYVGASGNYNAGAATISGPFSISASTYFEFTLTPDQGYSIKINAISFGSRSTSTGPKSYSFKSSIDLYNNDLAAGSLNIDSKWYLINNSVSTLNEGNTSSTFRIYGFNGVGSTKNIAVWRLDDLALDVSVTSFLTYFRSRQDGDWTTPSTWEFSSDQVNWNIASKAPTKDAENILIQSSHTVKITSPVSLDQTTVMGRLELVTGGVLNINDGVGDDLIISPDGILKIVSADNYNLSVNQSANANIHVATNGKILLGDAIVAIGNGYEKFATSLSNKWDNGSVFEYNNKAPFETPGLTYFPNAASNTVPIFRVSTVSGTPGVGSGLDLNINGILEVKTDLTFSGTGDKYFRNGIRGTATLSQTGTGQFYLKETNAILDGSSLKIILSYNLKLSSSSIVPIGANVTVSGANIDNNLSGNTFTINGSLDVKSFGIKNTNGIIILNGILRTASTGGFSGSGSSIVSGSIVVNPGSTIELYATGDQTLNARSDFSNLIFSGSGLKKPNGPFIPSGTITIKDDAVFDCSGNINGINIGNDNTNLTMTDNSRLIVSTYGPNPKIGGLYNLTGGVIEFKGSSGTPETIRSKNYRKIEITGSNVLMSQGNISLNDGGIFMIKNGGVFSINDNTIIGSGNGTETIIIDSGGTAKCGNNLGFNGSEITSIPIQSSSIHRNITQIILKPGSTIEYSRSGDQPITNANGLTYQKLVLSGTGNKIAPPGDLIIWENFSKISTTVFVHNNGTVIFKGTKFQNYSSTAPQVIFNNLTNKNSSGLNINDSLSVHKKLLLDDNSIINLNGHISLLSDKFQTAYLSRLGINANINYYNGRFIVERYINTNTINGGHQKSWQFLATPAFGETIFDTWQEGGNKNMAGYGTWITGVSNADNSFDAISPAPSMKYYDAENNKWVGIGSTKADLENKRGYMIFVRGDRMTRDVNSAPVSTVLRTKGKLYESNFSPPVSIVPAGKFQSIGNPYASAIDFTKISFSNNLSSYIAWDPTLSGTYGLGGYQTISEVTNFHPIPGNTANYQSSSAYQNIQSGQVFFVQNFYSFPISISFTNLCKLDDANHLVNKVKSSERQILFANLFADNGDIADGNAVAFDHEFSDKIDEKDVLKIYNNGENFSIKSNQSILSVEAKDNIKAIDTIFYDLHNLLKREYKFIFNPENFQEDLSATLTDQYLHDEKPISLKDSTVIIFSVTSDDASKKPDRFFLTFKRLAANANIIFSVKAYLENKNIRLMWTFENGKNIKEHQVEHSADGIQFSTIKVYTSNDSSNQYSFLDNHPLNGANFYRIKAVKLNGMIEYSEIQKIIMSNLLTGIRAVLNPIKNDRINLEFINQAGGKYRLYLFNSIGQKLFSTEINYAGGNGIQSIYFKKETPVGIYKLEIFKPDDSKTMLNIIK
ncbi:MAG: hypothetical protein ABI372_10380 [Ginsengibacter sp.]